MNDNIESRLEANTENFETEKELKVSRINDGNPSSEGLHIYKKFMQEMHKKYPDKDYPDEKILEKIENFDSVAYVAHNPEGEVIGLLDGEIIQNGFHALWFVVDPERQNSEAAQKIWDLAFSDFDKIDLIADVFGIDKNLTEKQKAAKQKALVRYYKRMGFKPDKKSPLYEYPYNPNKPMPMIWEKQKNENIF